MEPSDFERLSEDCFRELFQKAKETNEVQYLTSFFAFYNKYGKDILDYITQYAFGAVLGLINDFKPALDSEETENKTKTRIRMLIYCQIIEADFIYMVIYNMLRTIGKQAYSPIITITTKKKRAIELIYPFDKIEAVKRESTRLKLSCGTLYEEFYSNHLRNAFSHSQYFLHNDGNLSISKFLSPTSSKIYQNTPSIRPHYKYGEIENIYRKTLAYAKAFINTYKECLAGYMDGNGHPTIFGNIIFDKSHGSWKFERKH